MIRDEFDNSRLSYRNRYLKDFSSDDIKQLSFDFSSSYKPYNAVILKECRSIYKKKDGTLIVRITKHRPIQDSEHWCSPGYVNGYGHKMVDYYEQYKFYLDY